MSGRSTFRAMEIDSSLIADLTASAFERIGEKISDSHQRTPPFLRTQFRGNVGLQTKIRTNDIFPDAEEFEDIVPRFRPTLIPTARTATFAAIQEWEGYVLAIKGDHLVANLIDITSGSTRANEEAEIPLVELSDNDVPKLKPGLIFRWVIGYQRYPSGQKMRTSQIVFRELPRWTAKDIRDLQSEAAELAKYLNATSTERE